MPIESMILLPILSIMGSRMKTTIEIPDDLMKAAKALARKQGTTLKSIIERGIRTTLKEEQRGSPYQLADRSVKGKGLQDEFQQAKWADIRDAAYRERGS
jgi:Arc/MetJ family transcription regulator